MLPPRLCYIGLYLLSLTYTAQSIVMITANSDDVKNLAQKFLSDSLADKVSEFLTIAKVNDEADENDINDVRKDVPMDASSDIANDYIEQYNREIYKDKPFRTTKDLNTPPVRDIDNLYPTSEAKPKWHKAYKLVALDKLAKRPKKLVKKYHKESSGVHRSSQFANLAKALQRVDKNVQVIDLKKALYDYDVGTVGLSRKKDLSNHTLLHHPHIDRLKTIEEESVSSEEVEGKTHRKPSQPNKGIQARSKLISKYKQRKRDSEDNNSKPGVDKQDHINDREDPDTSIEAHTVTKKKESKQVTEPVAFVKQSHNDDSQSDDNEDFKTSRNYNFKLDHIEKIDQNPIHKLQPKTTPQSTVLSHDRIPKRLLKYQKMVKPKKIHHVGKNRHRKEDKVKSSRYLKNKYFPNKPKAPIEEGKPRTYDDHDISLESKEMKNLHRTDNTPLSEIQDSPSNTNLYPKLRNIHHLEPKPDNDNSEQAKDDVKENNDNTENSNKVHFLTAKIPNPTPIPTRVSKQNKTKTNYPQDSEEADITTIKDERSQSTKSTVYHGYHKVTDVTLNEERNKEGSESQTETPDVMAASRKLKLSNPAQDREYAELWDKLEK